MKPELKLKYESIRRKNELELAKRLAECRESDPAFAELESLRGECIRALLSGRTTKVESESKLSALLERRCVLLKAHGLPENWLDPIYSCILCKDTGYTGGELMQPCSCLLRLEQEAIRDSSKVNPLESFESFRDDLFSGEQQQRQNKIRRYCERYANELPDSSPRGLLLYGKPGSGKSFLGKAMALRAMDRGIRAEFVTAYRLISDVQSGISERRDGLAPHCTVTLMVLDDLGTEPLIPNITIESLFSLINERINLGLPTVIITNHSPAELYERYGERTASRLTDARFFDALCFTGDNLRRRRF